MRKCGSVGRDHTVRHADVHHRRLVIHNGRQRSRAIAPVLLQRLPGCINVLIQQALHQHHVPMRIHLVLANGVAERENHGNLRRMVAKA